MSDLIEFRRLNFFTGFFTTAADWNEGQEYHLRKRKLHAQGMHTPGIIRGMADELGVEAIGGLGIRVLPGAALDGEGNTICLDQSRTLTISAPDQLPRPVYIAIAYHEEQTDYVENVEVPEYSGHTRVAERPDLTYMYDPPDNQTWLELARIDLQPGVTEITDPDDPDNPLGNEIDRRHALWAGSVNVVDQQMLAAIHERLMVLHDYHLEKHRLHNRRLHTPGIMRGEEQELEVRAAGGFDVQVLPGAALDGEGNIIRLEASRTLTIVPPPGLPQLVYVAIRYENGFAEYLENLTARRGEAVEVPRLRITTAQPDNQTWLELARIDLQLGVTEITDPDDPDNPLGNEIDRRHTLWAGSVGLVQPQLPPAMLERIIQLMARTRDDFAALDGRFPVPSAADVRHAALTAEMLARMGCLAPEQLPGTLAAMVAIEQDVRQEIEDAYPAVRALSEFQAYRDAVAALQDSLRHGEDLDRLLNRQDAVAIAARELSEVVIQPPIADAGPDQTVVTPDDQTLVTLDASRSRTVGGREIERYRWEKKR